MPTFIKIGMAACVLYHGLTEQASPLPDDKLPCLDAHNCYVPAHAVYAKTIEAVQHGCYS